MSLLDRVRALLGDDAVEIAGGADAVPRVAPASPDAVALLLGTAREEGWRVRLEGAGTWLPADAPADLALTTRRLDRVPAVEPQDLSATAEAGIGCDLLRQQLADRGTWLALDPPGLAGRTLGSVVATATAGPLRHGFGAVRDHILGVTFVTGDGRLVQSGGRVVKNVAGYDLTKLEAGGFGAFGVIVLVHLRLRALPRADQTLVLEGTREDLTQVAEDVAAAGLQPAALELMSPALARRDGWALAVRLAGSAALVAAEEAGLRGASGGRFTALRAEEAHGFWMRAAESFATRPITFRTGGLPDSSDELLDLLQHQVGDEWVSASPGVGAIRWAGDTTVDRLRRLRARLPVGRGLWAWDGGGARPARDPAPPLSARARGPVGADVARHVTHGVRARADAAGDGDPTPAGGVGEASVRDGDAGGDEANAERETRNAEQTRGPQFRVPRSHFRVAVPRLRHGRLVRACPRCDHPHAAGQRLLPAPGPGTSLLRRTACARRTARGGAPARPGECRGVRRGRRADRRQQRWVRSDAEGVRASGRRRGFHGTGARRHRVARRGGRAPAGGTGRRTGGVRPAVPSPARAAHRRRAAPGARRDPRAPGHVPPRRSPMLA